MEEGRSHFKILIRKPTERRHLETSRHRWEDSTRMNLKEIEISVGSWIDLTHSKVY